MLLHSRDERHDQEESMPGIALDLAKYGQSPRAKDKNPAAGRQQK